MPQDNYRTLDDIDNMSIGTRHGYDTTHT